MTHLEKNDEGSSLRIFSLLLRQLTFFSVPVTLHSPVGKMCFAFRSLQEEQIALRKLEEERRHQHKLQSQKDRRHELRWCAKKRDVARVSLPHLPELT